MILVSKVVICSLAMSILGVQLAGAQSNDYRLEQVIDPIICTSTAVNTGSFVAVSNSCDESYVPTVTEVIVTDETIMLRGKFDAANARSFKISVFGTWFVYGESPLLTASGNDWQLELSSYRKSIEPGVYDVVLEYMTHSSLLYKDTIRNYITIPIRQIPDSDNENEKPPHSSEDSLADTGRTILLTLGVGALMVAAGTWLLARVKRH